MKHSLLTLILVLALAIGMCVPATAEDNNFGIDLSDGIDIMYITTNVLGTGMIDDIVYSALTDFVAEVGGSVNVFECAYDASLYESSVVDSCASGDYELVVTGYYNMQEAIEIAAEEYPDQAILAFDVEIPHDDGKNANVISFQGAQNECAFLAGVLAALMTESPDVELANEDKVVGFVGAAENTAIQDFLVGYIEGVNYVDSSIEVLYSFVGNWSDTALCKELALAQYNSGADISFAVCGSAGLGLAEAAKDTNRYGIGVDYDFAAQLETTNPDTAEHVVTSAMKDFYTLTTMNLNAIKDGTAQWGTHTMYNYAQGGCMLIENDYYNKIVPESVKAAYAEITEKLANGEIEVGTAIGATTEEIDAYKEQAKPF